MKPAPGPGIVARAAGGARAARVVDARRIAFCRVVRQLIDEQEVTLVELAAVTRDGVSDEYVRNLLDERRADIEIQLRDVAAWEKVLGRDVVDAFLRVYLGGYDLVARAPAVSDELTLLGATGSAMAAAGELVATVTAASADGVIDSAEAAEIHRVVEKSVPKLRAVAAQAQAQSPRRAAR